MSSYVLYVKSLRAPYFLTRRVVEVESGVKTKYMSEVGLIKL